MYGEKRNTDKCVRSQQQFKKMFKKADYKEVH